MTSRLAFFKRVLIFIYIFFITALIIYIFSYYSLQKGKVYDLFWIKSIQRNLYFAGFVKSFAKDIRCIKYDKQLLYVPKEGTCKYSNAEFNNNLSFTKHYRKNENSIELIDKNESPIAVLGDSIAMGVGVNNSETFSSIIERKLKRKVYNFGVYSFGTHREILRFVKSPYYNKIDKIIIQYNFNDFDENVEFDETKLYSIDDFNNLIDKKQMSASEKVFFALRKFKTTFRLFYREIKTILLKKKEPNFKRHREEILNVLEKYNYLDGKEIILFYSNSYNLQFEDYKVNKFKNIHFVEVNLDTKKHFFIVDDHINAKGHSELATQLIKIIKNEQW